MNNRMISIGGQALMEGIMMKGPQKYSVAVRKPDGSIDVKVYKNTPPKFSKIPVLRGMVNFVDSLVTGYKCLMSSAELSMGTELEEDKFEKWLRKHFGDKSTEIITMLAGLMGTVLALVLFMVLPTTITGIVDRVIPLGGFKAAVEGISKLGIFIVYLWAVSRMSEIKRVFMYHGAEHKTITCFERGMPLTVENVKKYSRFHPRCGTSFMFLVLLVSIVVFSFVPWKSTLGRAALKVVCLPVVVGIAYEILKYTGRKNNICTKFMAKPGLMFQRLTTAEPDETMIEVAIASVNAILPYTKIVTEEVKSRDNTENEQP